MTTASWNGSRPGGAMTPRRQKWNELLRAASLQSSAWLRAVVDDPGLKQSRLSTLACVKVLRMRDLNAGARMADDLSCSGCGARGWRLCPRCS